VPERRFDRLVNHRGERLDASFTPGAPGRRDLVLITHGVTSHKDRPWLEAVDAACVAAGLATLRFSFAGNGASEGRYADSCISKEVAEVGAVLDACAGWRVAFVGHSMGGAVGTLVAARDGRLAALVSLAGMVHVQAFMERVFGHLTPDRDVMLEKPQCPLTRAFLADARALGSVLPAARGLRLPWRVVHGSADELVPLSDAADLVRAAAGRADLVVLPGADHRFSGAHDALVDAVVPWLTRTFAGLPEPPPAG